MYDQRIAGRSVRSKRRRKSKEPYCFAATCAAGLEQLVYEEIVSLGGREPLIEAGAVTWKAHSLKTAYLACLWSRCSSRILLRLAQFEARTPEDLYQGAGRIDWSRHFNNETNFAVSSVLVGSEEINHSHYASLKIKDAVVDQFRRRMWMFVPRVSAFICMLTGQARRFLWICPEKVCIGADIGPEPVKRR